MIHKNDGIRSGQVQTQTSDRGREKQDVDSGIGVEGLHDGVTFPWIGRSVHSHVSHTWHDTAKEVALDQVEHRPKLAEDEDTMLRCFVGHAHLFGGRKTDSTICQELSDVRIDKRKSTT